MSNATQTFRGKATPDTSGVYLPLYAQTNTTPGSLQTLINYTVPAGYKVVLLQVYASTVFEGYLEIKIDSIVHGSMRTGAAHKNCFFDWKPYLECSEGEIIKITFEAIAGRPASAIETYLQARILPV